MIRAVLFFVSGAASCAALAAYARGQADWLVYFSTWAAVTLIAALWGSKGQQS